MYYLSLWFPAAYRARLAALHDRVHRGAYRAQPSRRLYIPKPDCRQRPIAIAALEDKIVQRATAAVLNTRAMPSCASSESRCVLGPYQDPFQRQNVQY